MSDFLKAGQVFHQYLIVKLIGRGGMGEVYEAVETPIHRKVALKLIPKNLEGGADEVQRFLNEAQALAKVTHPNVVTLFNVGEHENFHYIAMEFVEGRSLRDLFDRHVFSFKEATALGIQVLEGISALHEQNILHRDLTPRNIIVRPNGTLKIIDLGIAKQVGQKDLTQAGMIVGTVSYMAPEVIYGLPATARTDLWAIGAMLFEATSGQPLTSSTSSLNAQEYPKESQGWVPAGFRRIVGRLCAQKPEDRYASAQETIEDLKKNFGAHTTEGQKGIVAIARDIENLDSVQSTLAQSDLSKITAKRALTIALQMTQKSVLPTAGGNKDMTEVIRTDSTVQVDLKNVQAAVQQLRQINRPASAPAPFVPTPQPRRINWAMPALFLAVVAGAFYFYQQKKKVLAPAAPVAAKPALPEQITPTNPSTIWLRAGETPKVTWTPALNEPATIETSHLESFETQQSWAAQGSEALLTTAANEGKYFWRLKAGGKIFGPFSIQVFKATPPVPVSPLSGNSISPVDFSWNCRPGVTLYRVQVGRDAEFQSLLAEGQTRECLWKQITIPNGKYFWRVRVEQPVEGQAWSSPVEFTAGAQVNPVAAAAKAQAETDAQAEAQAARAKLLNNLGAGSPDTPRNPAAAAAAPAPTPTKIIPLDPPAALTPPDRSTIGFARGTLSPVTWQPVNGATGYVVEFASDSAFSNPMRRRAESPSTEYRPKWIDARQIFWRVRAEGPNGSVSEWSQARSFEIGR